MRFEDDYGQIVALPSDAKLDKLGFGPDRGSREAGGFYISTSINYDDDITLYFRSRERALEIFELLETLLIR